jgi:CheY-like chemotaxis protein/HPt (histidine-containing phosphotransfer) domain-containing protein
MLSSADGPQDMQHFTQAGAAAYLVKPIKQSELFNAIVAHLGVAVEDFVANVPSSFEHAERPLKILLAEDSYVNQQLAVGLLTRWGHTVVVANNGLEAVAALDKEKFDVVLMDVQMPEMDGFQATAVIRENEMRRGGHIWIIAMTAHAMAGDREECLAAGMDAYVAKPIRREHLQAALLQAPQTTMATSAEQNTSPHTKIAAPILDWEAALANVEGNAEMWRELANLVLVECPKMLTLLKSSLEKQDAASVRRAVHTMKSNFRLMGATSVSTQAEQFEMLAKSNQLAEITQALPAYEIAVEEALSAIREQMRR